MWNAAHFLGILAFSSDSEGRSRVFPGRIEKASNNSLKSLMLEGRTGESCEYTQDIIWKFVCCGLLESMDQKDKDCGCSQVYKTDQADWINPWFTDGFHWLFSSLNPPVLMIHKPAKPAQWARPDCKDWSQFARILTWTQFKVAFI